MLIQFSLSFLILAALSAMAKAPVAKGAVAKPSVVDVDSVLSRYRAGKPVHAKVKKTVIQDLMGTTNTSEGSFYFAKGRLRLDIDQPEKSTLVYDGKNIWLESRLDDNQIQVSHFRAGQLKRSDSLLAALFDRKDVLRGFHLLSASDEGGLKVYAFEPKDKKGTEIRYLEVALKGRELARIKYKDQMENTVSFEFAGFSKEGVSMSKFKYKPPKGASVTEL